MKSLSLGDRVAGWAAKQASVRALLLIGSRARAQDSIGSCDEGSDWDFQVVSDEVDGFIDDDWLVRENVGVPLTYVMRAGRLNSVKKVTAVFEEGELDLVIIPYKQFRMVALIVRLGLMNLFPKSSSSLRNLAAVWKGGVVVLKGDFRVTLLVDAMKARINSGRLDDEEVCALANGFVCDYVSAKRKLARGEMLAAQRWLHLHLAEVNFQLLHEWRQRRGLLSFPDARRTESLLSKREMKLVEVKVIPNEISVSMALEECASACVELMGKLVGSKWSWPELPSALSRKQFRDDVL